MQKKAELEGLNQEFAQYEQKAATVSRMSSSAVDDGMLEKLERENQVGRLNHYWHFGLSTQQPPTKFN